MQANQGQIQIPLPTITDDPRWIGRFSREVRKSIAALRDRKIIITGQPIRPVNNASTLPFEVSATSAALRAEAGTFCSVYFAATIQSSPANGNWYFYGKAIINQTTGVVSSPTVAWYSATQTSTSTDKYHLIGTAGLTAGVVTYYDNTDYGPISNYPHGDVTDNWTLFFF